VDARQTEGELVSESKPPPWPGIHAGTGTNDHRHLWRPYTALADGEEVVIEACQVCGVPLLTPDVSKGCDEPQYPVHWRDPYNGDTERIARDAAAYHEMMCQGACCDEDDDEARDG